MKPRDKERLVRSRPALMRSMDVVVILPALRQAGAFSDADEAAVMAPPQRRRRAVALLDIVEKKRSEEYAVFLEALSQHYPHLYLTLTDWDDEDDVGDGSTGGVDRAEEGGPGGGGRDPANPDAGEWSVVQLARAYLVDEVDVAKVLPFMRRRADHLTAAEMRFVLGQTDAPTRTETLLDLLETKPPTVYEALVDAIGESYPHVYLRLIGDDSDDATDSDSDYDGI